MFVGDNLRMLAARLEEFDVLDGIEPPIWRRLVVPAWFTLEKVHGVLQTALGWSDSHLHMFRFGDERVGIPEEFEDSRRWVGPAFEPERFDLRLVNQQLGRW